MVTKTLVEGVLDKETSYAHEGHSEAAGRFTLQPITARGVAHYVISRPGTLGIVVLCGRKRDDVWYKKITRITRQQHMNFVLTTVFNVMS